MLCNSNWLWICLLSSLILLCCIRCWVVVGGKGVWWCSGSFCMFVIDVFLYIMGVLLLMFCFFLGMDC